MRPAKYVVQLSDTTFQESTRTEEGGTELKWSRNFNRIHIPIKDIQVVNGFTVHAIDFSGREELVANPNARVTPNIANNLMIKGLIDEAVFTDNLYFTAELDAEKKLFAVEQNKGKLQVLIRASTASDGKSRANEGTYWGTAYRLKREEIDTDDLVLDLTLPEHQLVSLCNDLLEDRNNLKLNVDVLLLSYTSELEDYNDSGLYRDIIINDSIAWTDCYIASISLASDVAASLPVQKKEEQEEAIPLDIPKPLEKKITHIEDNTYAKALSGIAKALWVLAVISLLHFFK
ncbi:hypothetical protein NT239_15125 [Chitinibacter sp. SCUT-21]|uniref:hypothetical protein n=1 Tax=Chitinibacter sp. SCUT-21 TaxID=2970891 RepID=UPI0035A6C335